MSPKRRSKCARFAALKKVIRQSRQWPILEVGLPPGWFVMHSDPSVELLATMDWAKREVQRICGIDMGDPRGDVHVEWARHNGKVTILSVLRQGQAERV